MKITIDLDKLKVNTVISLADDLGCKIEQPHRIMSKYAKQIMRGIKDNNLSGEEYDKLIIKYNKEEEIIQEQYNKDCNKYLEDIYEWLLNYNNKEN